MRPARTILLSLAPLVLVLPTASSGETYEKIGAAAKLLGAAVITYPGPVRVISSDLAEITDDDGNVWSVRRHSVNPCRFGLYGASERPAAEIDFAPLTGQYRFEASNLRGKRDLRLFGKGTSAAYCFRASEGDYRCFPDLLIPHLGTGQAQQVLASIEFALEDCGTPLPPY